MAEFNPTEAEVAAFDPDEMADRLLSVHNETVTQSHRAWLVRECMKIIRREAAMCAREATLSQRERELDARWAACKKSRKN